MKKLPIIVLALVVLALNAAAYTAGYTQAVNEQPKDIVVSWYNSTADTASFDVYTLPARGQVSIYPQAGIDVYNVQWSHVNDP